jgi:hypothetical protein
VGSKRPEAAGPPGIGLPPAAAEWEDEAGGASNSAFESAAESSSVFVGVGIEGAWVNIDGDSLFDFDEVENVFEGWADPAVINFESACEFEYEVGSAVFVDCGTGRGMCSLGIG